MLPRLALSAAEIENLPDRFAAADKAKRYPAEFQADRKSATFLPAEPGTRKARGFYWATAKAAPGRTARPILRRPFHLHDLFALPEGRDQTLKYVDQLSEWLKKGARGGTATVPQFSANTQFALVRRTMLLDDRGEIRPTPLTEQVQLQILHDPTTAPDREAWAPASKPSSNSPSVASGSWRARQADWVLFLTAKESGNTLPLWRRPTHRRIRSGSADHGFVPRLS